MTTEGKNRLDAITRLLTLEEAGFRIKEYLNTDISRRGAALFLVEGIAPAFSVGENEETLPDGILREAAFRLQQLVRNADLTARAGAFCFLVFTAGCGTEEQAREMVQNICEGMKSLRDWDFVCGGSYSPERACTYEDFLAAAADALGDARQEHLMFHLSEAEREHGKLPEFAPIPPYRPDTSCADMAFIGHLMETLYCGPKEQTVPGGLRMTADYLDAGEAYVVEKCSGSKSYEITTEWRREPPRVNNHNLKIISSVMMEQYLQLFRGQMVLACGRVREMEIQSPVMAERQKLRGSCAYLQCPLMEGGSCVGYISVNDNRRERLWTEQEVMTFYFAAKLIAAEILEQRYRRSTRLLLDLDRLTEAWNYNRFLKEGNHRLQKSSLLQAVVTMDIKNFKVLNADYGYEMGNKILMDVSGLLGRFTGGNECFARIEADKFVLLLEYQTAGGLKRRLEQLIRRVEQIRDKEKLGFDLCCMLGVCLVEPEDGDMARLVDCANSARKSLKNYHKSVCSFYSREAGLSLVKEQEMTLRMKGAISRKEFIVYYQPKVSVQEKNCIGLEALVRWQTADGALIQPGDFIPLFEKNGFITELDQYVFKLVCELVRSWMDEGRKPYPVAVNVSRIQLMEPDFLEKMVETCGQYGVPPCCLELEITESAFLHNPEAILETARKIKEKGFLLAMDDFGTGYSSLSLLKDLPVDVIKLDREFFRKELNRREKVIIANVIHMAKELDIQVISEGIETEEHEKFLEEIGCDLAQGYRYGRPGPIEQYLPMLYGNREEENGWNRE